MLHNQLLSALKMPITANIAQKTYTARRFPRTFYRAGRQFDATISVNFQTGDCKEFQPECHALWHLTITMVTNRGLKSPKVWSEKEWELAKNVALDVIHDAGVADHEAVVTTDAGYHVRRPLTESELQKLPDDLRASVTPSE